MLAQQFLRFVAPVVALAALVACAEQSAPAGGQTPAHVSVWRHSGTPAEQATFAKQVARFNAAQSRVRASVRTIAEGDYNDAVQAAAAAGELPDVLELDGPLVANYVYQDQLVALDGLLPASLLRAQLPSLRAQGTYGRHVWAVGTFDSGLGLYANRTLLEAAGVTYPIGVGDAWTARQFTAALAALAKHDKDGRVLDLKLNYGTGEWLSYGFAPLLYSAGGGLLDPATGSATGQLDSPASRSALRLLGSWARYADPNTDDKAFTSRRVALSWVGHWVYRDYVKALGDDLLVLPLPDLGHGTKTGQGSWAWTISAPRRSRGAAAAFLKFLLLDREVLRMANANGAVPGTRTALVHSQLYGQDGPLRVFAEQLLRSCAGRPASADCVAVPRPVTPAYPFISAQFGNAVSIALKGTDPGPALIQAARAIDKDRAANHGYR